MRHVLGSTRAVDGLDVGLRAACDFALPPTGINFLKKSSDMCKMHISVSLSLTHKNSR